MGLSAKLFFENNENETLFTRISLTPEQLEDARAKKDKLLELIKPELSSSLEVPVRHWLQGSYKNQTLVRPIQKGDEFDIDVGIYVLCNAEDEGLSALDVKQVNRSILEWYVSNRPEAKVGDSKTSCERLIYPSSFHIDIPIYYYDAETDTCKLAVQSDEWVDSDPKALQDWFNKKLSSLTPKSLAQLRRIIKYLKVWTAIKGKEDEIRIPSIAVTVLVADLYVEADDDDDAFIQTAVNVMNYIIENDSLDNPCGGGDLFGFKGNEYQKIKNRSDSLKNVCEFINKSEDSLQQYVLWSATFEHMFPPFIERIDEVSKNTNLPAITVPPKIKVRHLDKNKKLLSSGVKDEIKVFRDEELYFSIENDADYSETAEVHWIVRNQDAEAKRVNDLGHTSVLSVSEERYEGCSYSGTHYMECLVFDKNNIKGMGAVKVRITGLSRPLRNPPRKNYFKGR
ncbi:CBASS cGAMP synthase [Reinekea marina]|uniref:Cyclic GMP-AMP synthase n=1 Tax=Reinekea marina TaxID=1310421 RepID=A0ABV7WWC7_9GAMM|nr:CBASS cGAMP synthase [Reinekea marina]MDN3650088.1 CBASS cGAMP synthase [Reinekea marina]